MTHVQRRAAKFWKMAVLAVMGFEIVLHTSAFTLLMMNQVAPVVAIVICAMAFVGARVALSYCKSRMEPVGAISHGSI
jgi:hypothetical protein